jgi:predicted alpha/beta-hydrolase family hydrolase
MKSPEGDETVETTVQFEEIEIPLVEPIHGLNVVKGTLGVPEWWPTGSRVSVVIAQASMAEDPMLDAIQRELTERKYLTLRFPMPYMVAGKKKPDDMKIMTRTYEAAIAVLGKDPSSAPAHVFAGGKNMGALVASHSATARLRVEGMFFLGFPLHKQDDTSEIRAERLYRVVNPMLFVQGEKDRSCHLPTLRETLGRVGAPVNLHVVKDADHSLKTPKKGGRGPDQIAQEILVTLEGWMKKTLGDPL